MKTSVIGFPRIGEHRELKFAVQNYWKKAITAEELKDIAKDLRKKHWLEQKSVGVDYISCNDFSLYDNMLDTIVTLGVIPIKYKALNVNELDTYFAMARGYQGPEGDVTALTMKKWFNTNYHYLVPELDDTTTFELNTKGVFESYEEAKAYGVDSKIQIIGPFTFLKLSRIKGDTRIDAYVNEIGTAYRELIKRCDIKSVEWLQIDEPSLVKDLDKDDIELFRAIYTKVLGDKRCTKVLLQTYFGDVRDIYKDLLELPFDGIGLDFVEGAKNLELVRTHGFKADKVLFAGMVNGKNIWRCDYNFALRSLTALKEDCEQIVINTSCSLLHSPYTIKNEQNISEEKLRHFAFAVEKLQELKELSILGAEDKPFEAHIYTQNQKLHGLKQRITNDEVWLKSNSLVEADFTRKGERKERQQLQKEIFGLPVLPTTTIGSFPQTTEVRRNRYQYKQGLISHDTYQENIQAMIREVVKQQEAIGLDVLVHGEFERNDMVEFFGEKLTGFEFTSNGWVQSYGSRCVKPPIIFEDISRPTPMTVELSSYASSLTNKVVKGMLTGPVTILNWSFPREDIELKLMAYQIGLAIKEEVEDLERSGIKMIQIDEAALREKLPLRREAWNKDYLDWAIKAFRLCHSGVADDTQIHTHMCYSEFEDIIDAIDAMDADVITFEASRSKLDLLDSIDAHGFDTEIGPGIYDIHSPRVPSVSELVDVIHNMASKFDVEALWVNPDCGLKTRGIDETLDSLNNMIEAAKIVRQELV